MELFALVFSLIGAIFVLATSLGIIGLVLFCYLLMLKESVGFVAKKAGHRWVTIGLFLVVLSVVAGIAWNCLEGRVILAVLLYFMPAIRLVSMLWSKRKGEYTIHEKLYAGLLFLVGAFSIVGPLLMVPHAVWQSLGPIIQSTK